MTYTSQKPKRSVEEQARCPHTIRRTKRVETEDWYSGETTVEFVDVDVSCENDIDLHRIQCSLCGRINYYSGAARQYYENGVKSLGIKGLE